MAVTFHDSFVGTAGEDLVVRTPDTVGTSWAETKSNTAVQEIDVSGRCDSTAVANSAHHVYRGRPNTTNDEYDVEVTCSAVDTAGDDALFVVGRYTDIDNTYGYHLAGAVQKLYKKVTSTVTELATLSTTYAANDVFKLEIRDAAKKCYQNGTERLSSTDNAITAVGEGGFGLGNIFVSTQDIETSWDTAEVKITEVEAGVTVTPGTLAMTLATFAPTVLAPRLVTPGVLALTTSTFAPAVTIGVLLTPPTATLATTTFAPTVTATANQLVTPGVAALTTATFAPTVRVGVQVVPSTAALTLTTFAPTVTATGELAGTQFYTTAGTMRTMGRRRR